MDGGFLVLRLQLGVNPEVRARWKSIDMRFPELHVLP